MTERFAYRDERGMRKSITRHRRPARVQLRRIKGWRMPPQTVKVDRTTVFGNPFTVFACETAETAVESFRDWLGESVKGRFFPAERDRLLAALPTLRGLNLACWCKPGAPCHADVLLELANPTP